VDTRLFVGRNLRFVGSCAFGIDEYLDVKYVSVGGIGV